MSIELSDEQREVVNGAIEWFNHGEEQVYSISGGAGVGKSFCLHEIIKRLGLTPDEVAPMAFSGAAAIVMRRNGFLNAKTIHSWIYSFSLERDKEGKLRKKFKYIGLPKSIRLVVMDEASFTGAKVAKDLEKSRVPIIACGDLNQLPPVKDEPYYLSDPSKVHMLTKIYRQSEGSAIIDISRMVLEGKTPRVGNYGDVIVITRSDFYNNLYQIVKEYGIIICGTNRTRDRLNETIRREIYGFDSPLPVRGDKVICRKNNWEIELEGINLVNGLYGTAMSTPSISSFKDGYFEMDFKPIFMDSVFEKLKIDYNYFKADYFTRNRMKESFLDINEYEKFEYAYSITTHVSQGSQFNTGVYLEEFLPSHTRNLNYTGITRFRNKAIYVIPDKKRFWSSTALQTKLLNLIPVPKVR